MRNGAVRRAAEQLDRRLQVASKVLGRPEARCLLVVIDEDGVLILGRRVQVVQARAQPLHFLRSTHHLPTGQVCGQASAAFGGRVQTLLSETCFIVR